MTAIQIILLILNLLKNLRSSTTQEEFAASPSAAAIGDGRIIKWIWDNREQIIEFVIDLIGRISQPTASTYSADEASVTVLSLNDLLEELKSAA